MKTKTSLIIASAIAASLSLTALAPAVADPGRGEGYGQGKGMQGEQRGERGERGHRGGMMQLVCSDQGAARIEKALDRVNSRITLTDEQQALFETFKSTALSAQTEFADNCVAPTRGQGTDFVERLKNRQSNMTATVAAMDDVIPALEAFYDGLTDEQKAEMKPKRGDKRGWRKDR
jgi:Spy/CpxP family protein refolding chaperone